MRYFLELAYNGSPFHGWQSQPNALSVQSTLENALSIILQDKINVVGAGRTDTGVHARQMFAHFDHVKKISNPSKFIVSLNSLIGRYISVLKLFEVSEDAHARFDATSRTYKYFISLKKDPFQTGLFYKSSKLLNLDLMNEAAKLLLHTEDFTSFAKLHSDTKTNICHVSLAEWRLLKHDKEALDFIGTLNDGIVFTIKADRFLRNMVRAIVGTLIEVGAGKLSIEAFETIIKKQNRCAAGSSIDAEGLFLWEVTYPFNLKTV